MKLALILLSLSLAALAAAEEWPWAGYGLPPSTNPCCIPLKRTDWAKDYHTAMLIREKQPGVQLLFLGDSITMMWRSQSGYEGGTPVWEQYYAPRRAANLGISGDRVEHLLWRLTEGADLEGLDPKVIVLLIGINNRLQEKHPAPQVAEGIRTVVNYLKAELPRTRILLLGDFPLWENPAHEDRAWVKQLNALLEPLGDRQRVSYLDIGEKFLEPDGTIVKEKLRDGLHLSEKGYRIWAEAMEPYLTDLLQGEGKGAVWSEKRN